MFYFSHPPGTSVGAPKNQWKTEPWHSWAVALTQTPGETGLVMVIYDVDCETKEELAEEGNAVEYQVPPDLFRIILTSHAPPQHSSNIPTTTKTLSTKGEKKKCVKIQPKMVERNGNRGGDAEFVSEGTGHKRPEVSTPRKQASRNEWRSDAAPRTKKSQWNDNPVRMAGQIGGVARSPKGDIRGMGMVRYIAFIVSH